MKFQLKRECLFGQQFLIVGDDPMFGLWEPSNAIPLNWSEGHVWTVEMVKKNVYICSFSFGSELEVCLDLLRLNS